MSRKESKYYVYGLTNPLKEGQYFYIGKGCNGRCDKHLTEAKKILEENKSNKWIDDNADNPFKTKTILKIWREGLEFSVVKLLENVSEDDAIDEEIRLIALYGRRNNGTGILTNLTNGGEGRSGIREDLTGQRFGRLTVEKFSSMKRNRSLWFCNCDCGNETIVTVTHLKMGRTKSCGCLQKERTGNATRSHGKSSSVEFRAWGKMFNHCNNSNSPAYKDYGGRGITICKRWLKFENFYKDVGERPSDKHILGRKDIDGDYNPENCKWTTQKEQNVKRRNAIILTIDNRCNSIKEWSEISGTKPNTITMRIRRKWTLREAVFGKNRNV